MSRCVHRTIGCVHSFSRDCCSDSRPICHTHRRRSCWTSGGRMASAEGGSVQSGVRYGEGCPLSSWLRGLGSVVSSPSVVRSRTPAENGFWHILKATERSFCTYMTKSGGGAICISVSRSNFWGGGALSPCPPWSTPMVTHCVLVRNSLPASCLQWVMTR